MKEAQDEGGGGGGGDDGGDDGGGGGEQEAAAAAAAVEAEIKQKAERKQRKKELKRAKTAKKEAAKEAAAAAAVEEAAKVIVLEFVVILDQPLGMKIDHVEGHNVYPAEITEVVPDGQGDKAGVLVGMYITAMNGEPTSGKVLDDIVQGVIAAKTEQTPLTMTLQLGGV